MRFNLFAPIRPGISIGNISLGVPQEIFEENLKQNLLLGIVRDIKKIENDYNFQYLFQLYSNVEKCEMNVTIPKPGLFLTRIGAGENYKGNWNSHIYSGITLTDLRNLKLTEFVEEYCIYLQKLPGIRFVLPNEWDDVEEIDTLPPDLKLVDIQVLEPIQFILPEED